jgi:hypothetical protein
MGERKIKEFQIGFLHTKWGGGDDLPTHGDRAKMTVLAAHLNADWHNTGRVEGHLVTQDQEGTVHVGAPDGQRTSHGTVREAMRALRAALGAGPSRTA